MQSELEYLVTAWDIIIFPPFELTDAQQVPPKTDGNNPSSTLIPVRNGVSPYNFSNSGLFYRTGQKWLIPYWFLIPSISTSNTLSYNV